MKSDRLAKLERFESLFEAPEQSFEAFLRRRDGSGGTNESQQVSSRSRSS